MKPNALQVKSEVNPGLTEVSERAAADFTETTAVLPAFHLYLPWRGNETELLYYTNTVFWFSNHVLEFPL